ncbi:MAG: ROK family protein [Candidatus Omnitrophica bacterium]|nr:ROK family protein [Candidatus Omnitrophota bacterium]
MAVRSEGMFTYHILQDRERKNLAILEIIRRRSPISKAEISRTLGYNIVTVTNYLDYYIEKKMVLEVGLDISSGGRRPELLELNARSGYVVGVDVGPDMITAIISDLKVKPLAQVKVPRPAVNMEEVIPTAVTVINDVIDKSKVDRKNIRCIGMGVSGIVDYYSGTIRDTDPARGRTKVSLPKVTAAIGQKFNIPVFIGNDASCGAFGEKTLNPAADAENLLYIYSDVGCGMIVHGEVYIGSSGCAGETQIVFEAPQADEKSYQKEFVFLRPWGVDLGVVAEAKKAIAKNVATEILGMAKGKAESITMDNVIDSAKKGDKVAAEIVRIAGRNLGVRVSYFINFFNPGVVIIGGGLERAGDIFLDSLKAAVRKFAFEEPVNAARIVPSSLGDNAVVLGAAALAAREVFIQA